MMTKLKDMATSKMVSSLIQTKLGEAGQVEDCRIDSKLKMIHLSVLLKGEPSPIRFTVEEYAISEVGNKPSIVIHKTSSSREWLNIIAANHLLNTSFPLPSVAAKAL